MAKDVILIENDKTRDVLYAKLANTDIAISRESSQDIDVVLNFDTQGAVIGVQLLGASAMPLDYWQKHPTRLDIPEPLREHLDAWFSKRQ